MIKVKVVKKNIKVEAYRIGLPGIDGSRWRNGTGIPSNLLGIDGDYFLENITSDVYARTAGVYTLQTNIKGLPGTTSLTLQQVLTAGSTLTSNNSINGFYNLDFGNVAVLNQFNVYTEDSLSLKSYANGDHNHFISLQTAGILHSIDDDNGFSNSFNMYPNGTVTTKGFETTSLIITGGNASQFVKADGSLDNSSYITASALNAYLPLSGGTLTGNVLFNSNLGIDTTATIGTDILNIGTTNANVINYGNASTIHNFIGTAIYELQVNSYVTDKLITVNSGGTLASAIGAGFEVEENGVITGYIKTNAARNGYSILSPANTYKADLNMDLLTADKAFSLPNTSGTIAVSTLPLSQFSSTTSLQLLNIISNPTGSGNLVFSDSPVFSTTIFTNRITGGTGVGDSVDIFSTSGVGTPSSPAFTMRGGSNGSVTILTGLNDGTLRIPNNRVFQGIDSGGINRAIFTWSSGDNITFTGKPGATDIVLNPTSGGVGVYIKSNGDLGIGAASPSARCHIIKTTEQLRVGYDAANYLKITVGSTGNTVLALAGTTPQLTLNQRLIINSQAITGVNGYAAYFNQTTGATNNFAAGFAGNIEITNASASAKLTITKNTSIGFFLNDGSSFAFGTGSAHKTEVYYNNTLNFRFGTNFELTDGVNIQTGTVTGSRVFNAANQKGAFWGATPIVQPTTSGTSATIVNGSGTNALQDDTYDGYTIGKAIRALRNTGLLQ